MPSINEKNSSLECECQRCGARLGLSAAAYQMATGIAQHCADCQKEIDEEEEAEEMRAAIRDRNRRYDAYVVLNTVNGEECHWCGYWCADDSALLLDKETAERVVNTFGGRLIKLYKVR